MIVTIDGASGTGKSSISRQLAGILNFFLLDTGALYRGIALGACLAGIENQNETVIADWLTHLDLKSKPTTDNAFLVLLEGHDIEPFIRNEVIANVASRLSAMQAVRSYLITLQREASQLGNLVAEGRDMGTVIFPQAEIKFFLIANPDKRAHRRWLQLKSTQPELTLVKVKNYLLARDKQDSHRFLAPLKPARDALIIDTTFLNEDNVLKILIYYANQRLGLI